MFLWCSYGQLVAVQHLSPGTSNKGKANDRQWLFKKETLQDTSISWSAPFQSGPGMIWGRSERFPAAHHPQDSPTAGWFLQASACPPSPVTKHVQSELWSHCMTQNQKHYYCYYYTFSSRQGPGTSSNTLIIALQKHFTALWEGLGGRQCDHDACKESQTVMLVFILFFLSSSFSMACIIPLSLQHALCVVPPCWPRNKLV